MVLRLYNSLTRKKEEFVPLDRANIRMYVCGPTVYDHAHIGNARPVIVFDVLYRLLRHIYGEAHVKYVRNITDVDDKIMERAAAEGLSIDALTKRTADQFHADVQALGCLPPNVEPRATGHIEEMKALIKTLIGKGCAYEAEGHVLFSVDAWKAYGELSGRSTDEMIAGARVEVAPYKKNPMDFVLWKPSAPGQPGWDSDWGRGRPGWHIECSAMAEKHLGEVFDIHGGGVDLKFPHHENEIAQSRCAFGTGAMAKYWMHNGYLQVEGEKMSKSAGNFVTIRELLRGWHGEPWSGAAIRLEMLGTHYRQPIDWTLARLKTAKAHVQMIAHITSIQGFRDDDGYKYAWSGEICPSAELLEALCDDLNTAQITNDIKRLSSSESKLNTDERIKLTHNVRFLGLMNERNHKWLTGSQGLFNMAENLVNSSSIRFRDYRIAQANNDVEVESNLRNWFNDKDIKVVDEHTIRYFGSSPTAGQIERLVDTRNAARKTKDFAEADRIRDELMAMGVVLKDNPDGTTEWEIAQ